jgi:hypothetical protein
MNVRVVMVFSPALLLLLAHALGGYLRDRSY